MSRAQRPTETDVLAALRELHSADPLALAERGPEELAEALSKGGFVRRGPAVDAVDAACEVLTLENSVPVLVG